MNNNKSEIDNILSKSGGKIDRSTLEKATKSGDTSSLVNSLSNEDKEKLNNILNDKEQLARVLKSPQAQMLLKLFGGAAAPKNEPSGRGANLKSGQNSGTNRGASHSAGGGKNG